MLELPQNILAGVITLLNTYRFSNVMIYFINTFDFLNTLPSIVSMMIAMMTIVMMITMVMIPDRIISMMITMVTMMITMVISVVISVVMPSIIGQRDRTHTHE